MTEEHWPGLAYAMLAYAMLSPTTAAADTAQEEEHHPWSVTGLIKPGQAVKELNW